MATLLLFAQAREAAGTHREELDAPTVAELVALAVERFGPGFAAVVPTCRVWLNGEPAEPGAAVAPGDEVAVLPPVSGG